MEDTKNTTCIGIIDSYADFLNETGLSCPYPDLTPLLENAQSLYRQEKPQWVEQLAAYYAHYSCKLMEEQEADFEIENHARRLHEWICEESHYIENTYPQQVTEMRDCFERKLEDINLEHEAYRMLENNNAENFLQRLEQCLSASGYATNLLRKSRLMAYLIRFGKNLCSFQLSTIIHIIRSIKENHLENVFDTQLIKETFKHQAEIYNKEISSLWFGTDTKKLEEKISDSVRFIALYLLMDFQEEKTRTTSDKLLAARIHRYLSRLNTPYSTLLKNKAYTILSDESTIDNRLSWDALETFTPSGFIEQLVNIRIDELNAPIDTQDNKWQQLDNGTNTLTLDKDGFTLSTTFPHKQPFWKGRKEKVELLDNRFFLATFLKPTYLFKNCKTIKDLQLYWKQYHVDYPVYTPAKHTTIASPLPMTHREEAADTNHHQIPESGEEVTIAITDTDNVGLYLEAVILDEAYRGQKAILPCTQINACYSYIPDFGTYFKKDALFKAKVVERNSEGIRVSLAQSYNEFIYADNVQLGKIPALVTSYEENKIKWLLMTGTTCVTPPNRWIKPQKGNIYLLDFISMDHQMMNARANVTKNKVFMPVEDFFKEVKRHLQEFINFQQKQQGEADERHQNELILKEKNNPFAQAFQGLGLIYENEEEEYNIQYTENTADNDIETTSVEHESLNMDIAEELIYCIGMLGEEKEDIHEQFNVYNYLQLLARFVGNKHLEEYHSICADYIYNINRLIEKPEKERFNSTSTYKLSILSARMEMLGMEQYAKNFGFFQKVINIFQAQNNIQHLNELQHDECPTIQGLARYFSILPLLGENDSNLMHIIYQNINSLLGYQEKPLKKPTIPIYFGHENVCCEFKSSAFIHANKDSDEDQSMVLARVVASFMNTDGGTLYIGVNDKGYLMGIQEDLNHVHNDRDNYLRTVNSQIIRLLGENKEAHNRYQEYIRCNLHEYDNQRMVLAFRVAPINEVVTLNGKVYTRSGSSCICKPEKNVKDFIAQRRITALNSVPRQPIFPTTFSEERQEYAFTPQEEEEIQYTRRITEVIQPPVVITPQETDEAKKTDTPVAKVKSNFKIQTSALRVNPLQKKPEMGYTNNHHFISLFNNGKIACSPSPKIGVWGENQGGKVICSYNTEGEEDLLVCVTHAGEVGIANLKKGFSDTNTPFAFVNDINDLLFISPASTSDHLLLIAEKDDTKRYRIIRLSDFSKPLGIQPKLTTLLKPEKGTYIYADILNETIMENIEDDKTSLDSFDQHNAGRFWEHTSYKQCVDIISEICNLPF